MNFSGLGVAVITPFTNHDKVDVPALEKILEHLISNQTDYLVILGTTAESVTLTKDEKKLVVETAIRVNNKRIPIVVGYGGNNTSLIVSDIRQADFSEIDGILSVSPYYNKPNQKGLYQHYSQIAQASPVPVIMYNVPGRTGSNISAETAVKLASEFSNITTIKEASGNFDQAMDIIKHRPADFAVVSGEDALLLPLLSIGMDGVISVVGNAFPKQFSEMIKAAKNGDYATAQKIHYSLLEIIRLLFVEGNPCGIKALMNILGFCETNLRLPLVPLSEENTSRLRAEVENLSV